MSGTDELPWLFFGAIIAGFVVIVIQVILREIRFARPSPKGERAKSSGGAIDSVSVDVPSFESSSSDSGSSDFSSDSGGSDFSGGGGEFGGGGSSGGWD